MIKRHRLIVALAAVIAVGISVFGASRLLTQPSNSLSDAPRSSPVPTPATTALKSRSVDQLLALLPPPSNIAKAIARAGISVTVDGNAVPMDSVLSTVRNVDQLSALGAYNATYAKDPAVSGHLDKAALDSIVAQISVARGIKEGVAEAVLAELVYRTAVAQGNVVSLAFVRHAEKVAWENSVTSAAPNETTLPLSSFQSAKTTALYQRSFTISNEENKILGHTIGAKRTRALARWFATQLANHKVVVKSRVGITPQDLPSLLPASLS